MITIGKPYKKQVRHKKENKKRYHWKDYDYWVCDIYGICGELYPTFDGRVEVDRGIVDMVVLLNQKGFTTWACCSGLKADHSVKPDWGYICFHQSVSSEKRMVLRKLADEAGFDEVSSFHSEVYCVPCDVSGTEVHIRAVWDKFYELVKAL